MFAKKNKNKQEHVAKGANQLEVGKVQRYNIHHWHIHFQAFPDISKLLLLREGHLRLTTRRSH
jgi:hypothetical protein